MPPLTSLPQLPRLSTGAAMIELVVHQLGQRLPLPAVQFGPFLAGQGAEAGEVLDAGAHLQKLKSESLMFEAAGDSGARVVHRTPVENLQEGE